MSTVPYLGNPSSFPVGPLRRDIAPRRTMYSDQIKGPSGPGPQDGTDDPHRAVPPKAQPAANPRPGVPGAF